MSIGTPSDAEPIADGPRAADAILDLRVEKDPQDRRRGVEEVPEDVNVRAPPGRGDLDAGHEVDRRRAPLPGRPGEAAVVS